MDSAAFPTANPNTPAIPTTPTLVTTTAVNTGRWTSILVVTAAVFTTLTGMGGASVAGVTFPAGAYLYGNFTTVTLASGAVTLFT